MTQDDYKRIAITVIGAIAAAYAIKYLKVWKLL